MCDLAWSRSSTNDVTSGGTCHVLTLFDHLPVWILVSDLHLRVLWKEIFQIINYLCAVQLQDVPYTKLIPLPSLFGFFDRVGTCPGPGCKEQTKKEGGREREMGGGGERERKGERDRERDTERETERERERAVRPRREWSDTNRMGFSTTEACRSVLKLDYH